MAWSMQIQTGGWTIARQHGDLVAAGGGIQRAIQYRPLNISYMWAMAAYRSDFDGAVGERIQCAPVPGDGKHAYRRDAADVLRWVLSVACASCTILDPLWAAGTTLRAAKDLGVQRHRRRSANERYCEIAANRLAQGVLAF